MKRIIVSSILIAIISLLMSLTVYASKKCGFPGCTDQANSGKNYCSFHICQDIKCNSMATSSRGYCTAHKCKSSDCKDRLWYTDGKYKGYCRNCAYKLADTATKRDSNSSSGTTKNGVYKTNNSSTSYRSTKNASSSSKKTQGSSISKKKYEMPDCDDYDSYDDFMDDWDGCMPDGSDAEDYWDNW